MFAPRALRPTRPATFSSRPTPPSDWNGPSGIKYWLRHPVGVVAQGHVGDVQEPLDAQVLGPLLEVGGEVADRLARSGGALVDRLRGQREDAARPVAAGDAVLRLAAPQGRDPAEGLDVRPQQVGAVGIGRLRLGEPAIGLGELADRHVEEPEEDFELDRLRPAGRGPAIDGGQFLPQSIDPALAPPLVRRPDLLERLRVRDRPREPDGQPLAAVLGPVLGVKRDAVAEPPGLPATSP